MHSLPSYFEFNYQVNGINATDLFSLNALLGTSIESQVVKVLNQQRRLWDPDEDWLGYAFERQAQAFPDVRLVRRNTGGVPEVALGIELKGWFLLAKEGMPSFRFATTAAACADHDLLCVVPWYLDNVLSGHPVAAEPWVVSARWAAEYRNHWWTNLRQVQAGADPGITVPANARPYPSKADEIVDLPHHDGGNNFGRLARVTGLMTAFIETTNNMDVLGIRIRDWFAFLRRHSDSADLDATAAQLEGNLQSALAERSAEQIRRITQAVLTMIAEGTVS
jgi:hypothetical protein